MLPTEKTPRKTQLSELTLLIHGPHKYGKSTWCSQADGALFLATEAGLNHVEVYQQPISTWDELLLSAKDIADGKHMFRTVIIDTIDNAYRMCADFVCKKYEVEHESDLEYGKGYAMVNAEFHRVLNKLALLPYGLFLISHSQEKEIETRTGKYTKVVPTLPDKARKLVLGLVDVILYCDLELTQGPDGKPAHRRVLRTKPSLAYEAGDRTGRLPEVLPLDFVAFAAAFADGAAAARGAIAAAASSSPPSAKRETTTEASPPPKGSADPTAAVSPAGAAQPDASPPTSSAETAPSAADDHHTPPAIQPADPPRQPAATATPPRTRGGASAGVAANSAARTASAPSRNR